MEAKYAVSSNLTSIHLVLEQQFVAQQKKTWTTDRFLVHTVLHQTFQKNSIDTIDYYCDIKKWSHVYLLFQQVCLLMVKGNMLS